MWQFLFGLRATNELSARRRSGRSRCAWAARRLFLERLEQRQVLAAIVIDGTGLSDTITIDSTGSDLVVTVTNSNTTTTTTHTGSIDSVTVNAGDGADVINIDGLPTASGGSSVVTEVEPNEDPAGLDDRPFAQDLDSAGWTLAEDPDVGDDGRAFACPDRCPPPHITVVGTGNDTVDVFQFTVTVSGPTVGIFDIDHTSLGYDSYIELLDASGTVIDSNDDNVVTSDGGGGSTQLGDSYLSHPFSASGTYYLRVGAFGGLDIAPIPDGAAYKLQVVLQNHALATAGAPTVVVNGDAGSDTLNIDASLTPGELHLGPAAFSGSFGDGQISYTSIENVSGTGPYRLQVDLAALGLEDGSDDTTFIRPNSSGTQLLVDINGVPFFAGAIANISDTVHNQDITVIGSNDNDTIQISGTILSAAVYGQGGNDTIATADGNDYVSGGTGNDMISGGNGQDRLYGNDGDDVLMGGGGNDLLSGGSGIDLLTGGAGRDVIIGGLGGDFAFGNGDRDLFFASGATNGEAGINGDSQSALDANDAAMLQLLSDWSLFLTINFTSTGNDGAIDWMIGGAGDDEVVGDGSYIFLE